jgi:dCMP deaminase
MWLDALDDLAHGFSTCSRRQCAAVILDTDKRVVGFGYNGAPPGVQHCIDGGCPRANSGVAKGTSYDDPMGFCIAQHAEGGALLYSDPARRRGGTLIVNSVPCFECTRLIVSSGIKRVVCWSEEGVDFTTVADFFKKGRVEFVVIGRS